MLARRPASLPRGHPMAALATQVAVTAPFGLLVALAAAGYRVPAPFPAGGWLSGVLLVAFAVLLRRAAGPDERAG